MLSESPGTPSFLSNPVGSPSSGAAVDPFTSIPTTPTTHAANPENDIFVPSSRPQSERLPAPAVMATTPEAELKISVTAPEKRGEGMTNSYVVYKVVTKTLSSIMKQPETRVERRYNDFFWLQSHLSVLHPECVIPPLPEKTGVMGTMGNKFSPEFLEYRRRELERFLRRVGAHPVLGRHADVISFLEANDEKFAILKQKTPEKPDPDTAPAAAAAPAPAPAQTGSGGFANSLSSFWGSTVSKVAAISSNVNSLVANTVEEVDKWFEVRGAYLALLESQLNAVARNSNALSRKHKELTELYVELSASCALVGDCEATADKPLAEGFNRLSGAFSASASLYKDLGDEETVHFEESVRDYVRFIGAVKDLLRRRSDLLSQYQALVRQLADKREKVKTATNAVYKQKLETEIAADEKSEVIKKQHFEQFSKSVRAEVERFEQQKGREMREIISRQVQHNMNMELQLVDSWKNILAMLQRDG